jgi:MarR family transcriptional regulator for hemolysin
MPTDIRSTTAQVLLETIPRIWRVFAADLRRHSWPGAPAQLGVLVMLVSGPQDLSALAERLQVSLPTISRMVASLAERGWIRRRRATDDRRRVVVELTESGQSSLAGLHAAARENIQASLANLSAEECGALLAGLEVLSTLLDSSGSCAPSD